MSSLDRRSSAAGFHLARTDQGWEWTTALGRTYPRPVTPLYEPGDNYWPLNYRQIDGYDPNPPAETGTATAATRPRRRPYDLPDDPPF